jgi:DTW domain-containing protein YfiP
LCGLHLELCACEYLPSIRARTRLIIVQNNHERTKPTNTARLLAHVVEGSQLIRYAVRGESFDPSPLHDAQRPQLLFPREDAAALEATAVDRPSTLVVLDGTWAQCSRMSRRIDALPGMPAVRLPPGPPTRWAGVRTIDDPSRVSTFEAGARALGVLEGPDGPGIRDAMLEFFAIVAARMLFMKGKLRTPDVPSQWLDGSGPDA